MTARGAAFDRHTRLVVTGATVLAVATALCWWGWIGFDPLPMNGRPGSHPAQTWRTAAFGLSLAALAVAAGAARLPESIILWTPVAVVAASTWIVLGRSPYRGISTIASTLWVVGGLVLLLGVMRFVRRFRRISAARRAEASFPPPAGG